MAYTTPTDMRKFMRNLPTSITDDDLLVFTNKATVYLDAKLGSLYVVPFDPVPPFINSLATDLAVYYALVAFYTSQKPNLDESVNDKWQHINETITAILSGDIDIGVPIPSGRVTGFASTNDRDPFFDYDTEW